MDETKHPIFEAIDRHLTAEMVAFDIGANYGWVTEVLAARAKRVIAFEPIPQLAEILREKAFPNTSVCQTALSNVQGTATFFIDKRPDLGGVGSSLLDLAGIESDSKEKINVQVSTIDRWVREWQIEPDFIKIDVEGCEELVIEGGMETIRRKHPYIIFEVWGYNWPRFASTVEALRDIYRFVRLGTGEDALKSYGRGVITENDDVICIPIG